MEYVLKERVALAKGYPREFCDQVVANSDIVDVIGQYVELKPGSGEYQGVCPFHADKNPSFGVNRVKGMYHCFGCQASGNVITFLKNYLKLDYSECIEYLAERNGMQLPTMVEKSGNYISNRDIYDINNEAGKYFYKNLFTEEGKKAVAYINERRLKKETVMKCGLGFSLKAPDALYNFLKEKKYSNKLMVTSGLVVYDQEKGKYRDRFRNRLMFPIFDIQGRIIGFGGRVLDDSKPKYLNSPETPVFKKRTNMFGLNIAVKTREKYIISCEGYMDVISLHQAGFNSAVASLGTALTEEQVHEIKKHVDKIYLSYDSDTAGVAATKKAIEKCKKEGLSTYIIDMKPYKDPDEFIKNLGVKEYENRIEKALSAFDFLREDYKDGFNLSNPDEKANYVNGLIRKIVELDDPINRGTYIQSLAANTGIKESVIEKKVNEIGQNYQNKEVAEISQEISRQDREKVRMKKSGTEEAQRIILSIVAEFPELYPRLKEYIQEADYEEGAIRNLASFMYEILSKGERLTSSLILNHFEDAVDSDQYAEILAYTVPYEEGDMEDEAKYKAKKYAEFAQSVTLVYEKKLKNRMDSAEQEKLVAMNEYMKFLRERKNILEELQKL